MSIAAKLTISRTNGTPYVLANAGDEVKLELAWLNGPHGALAIKALGVQKPLLEESKVSGFVFTYPA